MNVYTDDWLEAAFETIPNGPMLGPPELVQWQRKLLSILAPIVYHARIEGLHEVRNLGPLANAAADSWLTKPPIILIRRVVAAFVIDMNAARSLDNAPRGIDNWFEHHIEYLSSPATLRQFFERYPLLATLTQATITGWRDAGVEFAIRLASDIDAIEELVGTGPLRFLSVEPGYGDTHSRGRTVARVQFDGGYIAYKPRPSGAAVGLRNLIQQLSLTNGINFDFGVPEMIDHDNYAWMAWIHSKPCDTTVDQARYYYRLGQLSALAWLLGSSDLHSENVIAAGDKPYVVDVETIVSPILETDQVGHNHPIPNILVESPISTGLLPFGIPTADGRLIDFSAIGDDPQDTGGEATTWDFVETSAMVGVRRAIPREAPKSMPTVSSGKQQGALEFESDLNRGFTEALVSLRGDATSTITATVRDKLLWPSRSCRVVLRNTYDYSQIVALMSH